MISLTNCPLLLPNDKSWVNREINHWCSNNFISHVEYDGSGHLISKQNKMGGIYKARSQSRSFTNPNPNISVIGLNIKNEPKEFITPVMNLRIRDDGTYTQLPEAFIQALGNDPVELSNKPKSWEFSLERTILQDKGLSSDISKEMLSISGHIIRTDQYASFSFLRMVPGDSPIHKTIAFKPTVKCLSVKKLFRGSSEYNTVVEDIPGALLMKKHGSMHLFLIKQKVNFVDQSTTEIKTIHVISVATYIDPLKVIKYAKSRTWLRDFLDSLLGVGNKWVDQDAWKKDLESKAQAYTTFWHSGIDAIIGLGTDISSLKAPNQLTPILEAKDYVGIKEITLINNLSIAQTSPEAKQLNKIKGAIDSTKTAERKLLNEITTFTDNIKNHETQIQLHDAEIERYKKLIEAETLARQEEEKKISFKNQMISAVKTSIDKYSQKYEEALEIFNQHLNTVLSQDNQNVEKYFSNLANRSGVLIKDIQFTNFNNPTEHISIKVDPSILSNPDWKISKIHIMTTKPSVIWVDRDDTAQPKSVVGGPYEVIVSRLNQSQGAQMSIRLASSASVFGLKRDGQGYHAKIHPHVKHMPIDSRPETINRFLEQWATACQGAGAAALAKGFNDNNIKIVLNAIMAWITSAYSKDEWGADYHWFPTPNDVNIPTQQDIITVVAKTEDVSEDNEASEVEPIIETSKTILPIKNNVPLTNKTDVLNVLADAQVALES